MLQLVLMAVMVVMVFDAEADVDVDVDVDGVHVGSVLLGGPCARVCACPTLQARPNREGGRLLRACMLWMRLLTRRNARPSFPLLSTFPTE